jgi:hypothetical protein
MRTAGSWNTGTSEQAEMAMFAEAQDAELEMMLDLAIAQEDINNLDSPYRLMEDGITAEFLPYPSELSGVKTGDVLSDGRRVSGVVASSNGDLTLYVESDAQLEIRQLNATSRFLQEIERPLIESFETDPALIPQRQQDDIALIGGSFKIVVGRWSLGVEGNTADGFIFSADEKNLKLGLDTEGRIVGDDALKAKIDVDDGMKDAFGIGQASISESGMIKLSPRLGIGNTKVSAGPQVGFNGMEAVNRIVEPVRRTYEAANNLSMRMQIHESRNTSLNDIHDRIRVLEQQPATVIWEFKR